MPTPALHAPMPSSTAEVEAVTDEAPDATSREDEAEPNERPRRRMSPPRLALMVCLATAVALAALIGVLWVQAHRADQSAELRALYLQVGRQEALNLTTIDWHHADADVQRILSGATGTFYDDFAQRSQPFVDVVKKVQSVSVGTVNVAGLESSTETEAQVLVAVDVKTTTSEAPQESARAWRMRISVQKNGDDVKVSNVEFVP